MATLVRTGRYYAGGTPGVAHVAASMQWAYAANTESGSQTVIWHTIGSRLGTVPGVSSVTYQLAAMAVQSGQGSGGTRDVPAAVLARSGNHSVSATMDYGGAGVTVRHPLTNIITSPRNRRFAFAAASRHNTLAVGMVHAADISGSHNTYMYSRSAPGGSVQAGPGSGSNQGHMAVWMEGDINEAPTAPTDTLPSSGVYGTSLTPNISGDFNDENKKLSDGRDWDYAQQARIEVREGTSVIWDYTYTTNSTERANHRTIRRYSGRALKYYTTYSYRIRHRDRTGAWGPPSNWVYFSIQHSNRAPNAPSGFTGVGTLDGTLSTTISSAFTDPDLPTLPDGQAYERFDQKRGVLRRVSDNVVISDSGWIDTTTAERNSSRSSWAITLPEWDVNYRWYEYHRDRRGASSPAATTTVIARSGGSVDQPTTPSGRVTNFVNPGNIQFVYRNTGTANGTRIRVGIAYTNGSFRSQREVAKTVTRNTVTTVTWAELWDDENPAGFPFREEGTTWLYAVQVLDTNDNWTDYSPFQELNLNAAPLKPSLYGPGDGQPRSTVPTTAVRVSDPDQPNSQLTTTAEIYDGDTDTLLSTYDLPWLSSHAEDNIWGASPSLPGYGNYKWRARANDGYLDGPWSAMFSFTYAPVPDVQITEPAGPTVTTRQPVFAWSVPNQVRWRLQARDTDGALVYDTGELEDSRQNFTIGTDQYWLGGERWNNEETFVWTLGVRDTSGLWGWSASVSLTLEYIPPDQLIITEAEAMALPAAGGTHYVMIGWSQSQYAGDFLRYEIDRVEIDGPDGNEIEGTLQTNYAVISLASETILLDFDTTSNQWYRYAIRQIVQSGLDEVPSYPVYAESMISFSGILLHMPFDPLGSYAWLPFGEERYEPVVTWHQGHSEVMTTNGRAPYGYIDGTDYVEWEVTSTLVPREEATVAQQRDALRRIWSYQNKRFAPNRRPNTVCLREGRGGEDGRVYGRMSQPSRSHSYHSLYTIEFTFRELESMPVEGDTR